MLNSYSSFGIEASASKKTSWSFLAPGFVCRLCLVHNCLWVFCMGFCTSVSGFKSELNAFLNASSQGSHTFYA